MSESGDHSRRWVYTVRADSRTCTVKSRVSNIARARQESKPMPNPGSFGLSTKPSFAVIL